jgi:hypothetical protein
MRLPRAFLTPLLLALLPGCEADRVVRLDLPGPGDGARSMVLAVRRGEALDAYAVDLADPALSGLPPIRSGGEPVTLLARLHRGGLDALGLAPGPQRVALPGESSRSWVRRPLPEADLGLFARDLAPDDAGAWRAVEESPAGLVFDLRADPAPVAACPALEYVPLVPAGCGPGKPGWIFAIVPEPGGTALAVDLDGAMHRLTPGGIERLDARAPPGMFAAARTSTGALWLGGRGGALHVGTAEGGFRALPPRPELGTVRFLAVPTSTAAPAEVFQLGMTGVVGRLAGGGWTSWPVGARDDADFAGDLLWTGPGQAVALASPRQGIVRVAADRPPRAIPYEAQAALSSLALLDGRLFAIANLGVLVEQERVTGRFAERGGTALNLNGVRDLAPFAGGLLMVGRQGGVIGEGGTLLARLWRPDDRLCPGPALDTDDVAWAVTVSGESAYVVSGPLDVGSLEHPFPDTCARVGVLRVAR